MAGAAASVGASALLPTAAAGRGSPKPASETIDDRLDTDDGEPYYASISGTSMATPVVTGIVALLNDAYFREYGEYPDPPDQSDPPDESDGPETEARPGRPR